MTPRLLTDADFNAFAAIAIPIWLALVVALGLAIWRNRRRGQ